MDDISAIRERKRRRSRSPSVDSGARATKITRQDIQETLQSLKRARSESPEGIEGRSKRLRQVPLDFGLGLGTGSILNGKTGLLTPPEGPSLEFDGCLVYNPYFATYGTNGTLTPLSKEAMQHLVQSNTLPDTLTPESTPGEIKNNPLENPSPGVSMSHLVIVGDINAYGLLPGRLEIYENVNRQQPYSEIFRPKISSFSLGAFFPSMKGYSIDAIELENVTLSYLACTVDDLEYTGIYLQSDVIFTGVLQPISDVLHEYFGQQHPSLHLSTYLGAIRDWNSFPSINQLTLTGSIERMSAKLFDVLEFTRVGVELLIDANHDLSTGSSKWYFGYGFFGDVNVSVPGSVVPLQCHFHLQKLPSTYLLSITLKDEEWKEVFGIKGLNLSCVRFQAMINTGGNKTSFRLGVEAEMQWHKTAIAIGGSYGSDGYSLNAFVGDLSLQDIGELFQQMMGVELDIFDHDVVLKSMSLNISNHGFSLAGTVTINGHSSASGKLAFNRDGISISGGVKDMSFEGIDIHKAELDVFIGTKSKKSSTRETKVAITGDVSFAGIDLQVGVYTRKPGNGKPLEWAIYGEAKGDLSTSRLCPDLKGTFLDISLTGLALMAANHESNGGSYNTHGYPTVKGIQFCAIINSIPELEGLVRGSVKGTILRAGYSKGVFSLGLILPAKRTLTFSDDVYTGPISLAIQTGKDIKISLEAELNIKLSDQPDPLKFALGLRAGALDASAYGQLLTDWVNPCGVGKNVVIRGCALEFGIVYSTFVTTGMPGKIGLAGQLNIGEKEAKAAMMLSQNPSEQLLAASVKDMGVVDLVKFDSQILETDLPEPDNFLHFNEFDLYLSTGTTVGVTYYPPGASLKGDMHILGKRAKFNCSFVSAVKIMATIEPFSIGPLQITGATGSDPIVDVELSSSVQRVFIDGAVSIWGASAAIHLYADFLPSPKFDFAFQLKLSDLFLLQFRAKMTGQIDFKDLKSLENADFEVHARMEQHVIQYITEQVEQQVNSAQEALDKGFNAVKDKLAEKEREFQEGCQNAINKLEAARAVWHQKRDAIKGAFDHAKQDLETTRQNLQRKVDEAEAAWKGACAAAKQELENAKHKASAAIREAEADVNRAQQDSDNSIRDAQNELQRTKDDFYREFGSAQRDVENARHSVEEAERKVESIQNDINWKEREYDNAGFLACIPIRAEITGLHAAKGTAWLALEGVQGILWTAEQVIQGTGFLTAEGAIGAAQLALDGVREAKNLALEGVKKGLEETRELEEGAVQVAIDAVRVAEEACKELDVFNAARRALDEGCKVAQGVVDGAQVAVDKLASCTEFLAFDVAEKGLEFAKNNTKELKLARYAVNLAEGAAHLGLDIAKWAASHIGKLIDINKIEFDGSLKSLIADGPPLRVLIEGMLCGDQFSIELVWQPHFNLVAFIKSLFDRLWEIIKGGAKTAQSWASGHQDSNSPKLNSNDTQDVFKAPAPRSEYPGAALGLHENTKYSIINLASGTAIDLSGCNWVSISGYTPHGGQNQQWTFEPNDTHWRIRNVQTGRYLAPSQSFENINDGTIVTSSTDPANWNLYKDENLNAYR
ncbi:hypothetical protein AA313_de0203343 [Arthrobotrys entomopaga]|nr:hypothetical protein AA313_de0203343 [Arthrobotrys entomopaga]